MPKLNPKGGNTLRVYTGAGGTPVPSVTEVLRVLNGEWMNAFLARAGRREVARVMNDAAALGTKVHALADRLAWDRGVKVEPEMEPYAEAVREFLDLHVRRVIATELSLSSERLGFGGTVDLVCELQDGSIACADYKTVSGGVTKTHKLQVCAYGMLLREHGYKIQKRLVVKIHKSPDKLGKWYVRSASDHRLDVETFKSCLVVWHFMHGAKLRKLKKSAAHPVK